MSTETIKFGNNDRFEFTRNGNVLVATDNLPLGRYVPGAKECNRITFVDEASAKEALDMFVDDNLTSYSRING